MRNNPLRNQFELGQPAIGGWLSFPNSFSAEIVGRVGFDYVCIDMQHGMIGYDSALGMLQAIGLSNTTATVRVPWNEPGIIGKVLDSGAMAVIVPMVNTGEEAASAVARGKYAPAGSRSSGPTRVAPFEGSDYVDRANEESLIIPMVETVEALENLDAILSTPGVDVIYVGPNDLAVSMGFGRDCAEPEFLAALDKISAACTKHGVVAGIHAAPSTVLDRIDRGYSMVTVQSELAAMRQGLLSALELARGHSVEDAGSGGGY